MNPLLDLQVEIATRPPNTPPETGAPITLRCEALKLKYSEGLFSYPLTKNEREDLRWYLEEYPQWPFEGFAQRGAIVEQWLPMLGQRLYQAAFGEGEARDLIQQWQADTSGAHQISIITTDAGFLSLPWELLHDGHDFLALQANPPISIVRRIAESQQPSPLLPEAVFEKPLHVLLVTARPVDEGQVDARIIAREVVDALQEERSAGAIELEFLRPPTLDELEKRLSKKDRPVHILHFDGHGVFYQSPGNQNGSDEERGQLFFEKPNGEGDPVDAVSLAETLSYGNVQIAVLNACQSAAIGERDIYGSVAVQLLNGGLQAVVAMSASVLTTSAALYVKAFYGTLAAGGSLQVAHEQAQQALREQPERHAFQRYLDEAGEPISLQDWWLPHLYVQHSLELQPTSVSSELKLQLTPSSVRLRKGMPDELRYGFKGRARELLTIERWLTQEKLIIIHGFGGIGKTALAWEAADWLTRTGMYQGMCFVSFEGGRGSAISLLSQLGFFLGIYDGIYALDDPEVALQHLKVPLTAQRTLVIADNLESILPGGEATLEASERTELWNVLLSLRRLRAGVLLTSRDPLDSESLLAANAQVVHLPLRSLHPDDAYALAMQRLEYLGIPQTRTPYADLRDLLQQLDHHPLAIQLVLPTLREYSLAQIRSDFTKLLLTVTDDTTGRNRSLLASLDYSLRRLTNEHAALLHRLAVFEGGAMENRLIEITEIAEADWAELRKALEQAALLMVERLGEGFSVPYLHFHPILIPFLRGQSEPRDEALEFRYTQQYYKSSGVYFEGDMYIPRQIRVVVQRELPNLRRVLGWLLESGDLDRAVEMASHIGWFLTLFGLRQEQQRMHQRVTEALASRNPSDASTRAEYLNEMALGEEELRQGNFQAMRARFQRLLTRIESQPEGNPYGPGSLEHITTLGQLGRCLWNSGNYASAEPLYRRAIALIEALLQQYPENWRALALQSVMLADLGEVLLRQGQYTEATQAHEQSLQVDERLGNQRDQAVSLITLGTIALQEGAYTEARMRYQKALKIFHTLGGKDSEAIVWHQLGMLAVREQNWSEAEQSLLESLKIKDQLRDLVGAAATCNGLGVVAQSTNRLAEAKGWFQRAIELSQEADPTSGEYAMSLFRLAFCLVKEVQEKAGQDGSLQLEEARRYAEQALEIEQFLRSSRQWETFSLLATIAEMQGQNEARRVYRLQEKEGYASFADHRNLIDQEFGILFPALTIALDSLTVRTLMEECLSQLEANGWHISEAIHRIWAGERDWQTLVENLNNQEALFVLRVLETLATLPPTIRETLAKEDEHFQQAFEALSTQEQQVVMQIIQALHEWTIARFLPTFREMLEMLAKGDQQAFQQAFEVLSTQEQQAVMRAIQELSTSHQYNWLCQYVTTQPGKDSNARMDEQN